MANEGGGPKPEADLVVRLRACWRRLDPTETTDDPAGMAMASVLLAEAAAEIERLRGPSAPLTSKKCCHDPLDGNFTMKVEHDARANYVGITCGVCGHGVHIPLPESQIETKADEAWIIWFEDADRKPEVFTGHGATECARRRFEQISHSWNAHLFRRVSDNTRPALKT